MTVIYAFLAIRIIIFLHELGHFMAAKLVGVPVERFALGFDPYKARLISFKPGQFIEFFFGLIRIPIGDSKTADADEDSDQTEYLIGLVPFGGYVKMTGENPDDEEDSCPDGLQNKSAGARALVFVAGVVMNIISGFFFFIIAFSAGVEFPAPIIGGTIQGMPAWEAGLRAGDKILYVDGKPVTEYTEVLLGIALGERGMTVDLVVERAGEKEPLEFSIEPIEEPEAPSVPRIGVAAGGGTYVKNIAGHSSAVAVFKVDDRLLSIDGERVHSMQWEQFAKHYGKDTLVLKILRQGKEVEAGISGSGLLSLLLNSEVQWAGRDLRVGVLKDSSPLHKAGLRKGDQVIRIGDQAVYALDDLWDYLADSDQANRGLIVSRKGKEVKVAPPEGDIRSEEGITWQTFPTISMVTPNGPADKTGVTAGSKILQVNGKEIFSFSDLSSSIMAQAERQQDPQATKGLESNWIDPEGNTHKGTVTASSPAPANKGFILKSATVEIQAGILESFEFGIERSIITVEQVFLTLRSLIRRDVEAKNLAGPVGIIHIFSRVAEGSLVQLLFWMGMVSMNLAVLNLLPIPILDGGHLFFLLLEKMKGSPVSTKIQFASMQVALVLFLSLALYVTWNDISRLIFGF